MQIRAATTLTEIEGVLHKNTVTISSTMTSSSHATCFDRSPSISGIHSLVPEKHSCVTATFKHLDSDHAPSTDAPGSLSITPTVTAVVVDDIMVVDPQVASIIGYDTVAVMACPENSHATCPTHCEVIASSEAMPSATCVPVVDVMFPPSHVRASTVQVLKVASLAKVENVLHVKTVAISDAVCGDSPARCTHREPSVCSIRSPVSEEDTSRASMFKMFKPHPAPSMKVPGGFPVSPTVTTIVVDSIPVINKQISPIVRVDAESIMAIPEKSHKGCPTHSKVITPSESRPIASCVPVVDFPLPTSHIRPAAVQVLATAPLTEVECVFSEEAMAIDLRSWR
jgi:hypothetical protein